MSQLQVELVAADRKVWEGEADMVIARTSEGSLLGEDEDPGSHDRYMSSMRSPNISAIADRFSFWVAVSSPSS